MTPRILRSSIALLLMLFICETAFSQSSRSVCAAMPDPVTVMQADGSSITVVGKGNEALSYTETTDGYTIIQNKKGIFEYAAGGPQGMLVAGGITARDPHKRTPAELKLTQWLPKHMHHSQAIEEALVASFRPTNTGLSKQLSWGFPSKGNRKVLLLLIQYPDLMASIADTAFDNFMNEPQYRGTGSFRDFYLENSYQQLDLNTDVFGWYTASEPYAYYGRNNPAYMQHVQELVSQAVDSAEAEGVDFSQYDNDADGSVDGILVIHAGPGAESGSQLQYIWSHRAGLWGSPAYHDGVLIIDYGIMPELRGSNMVGIGVFCHEFGHILGLPDLYDTDPANGDSEGIGEWGSMGGGSWLGGEKTPCHFDPWSKMRLDWIHPVVVDTLGTYTLNAVTSDSLVYRVNTSNSKEYFLLENRQKKKFDLALKGKGLAIWHINEVRANRYPNSNDVNADENNKGVALEEADGLNHLNSKANRGDAGDLFPGSSNKVMFNNNSTPGSKLTNGDSTMHAVSDITDISEVVTFKFFAKPVAAFTTTPAFGCVPVNVQLKDASKFNSRILWSFGDGTFDSVPDVSHQYDSAGNYVVTQYVYGFDGNLADSAKKSIIASAGAEADFSFTTGSYNATFTNLSKKATFFIWNFGDGSAVVNDFEPIHTFATNGVFQVRLVANNQSNCLDTIIKTVDLSQHVGIGETAPEPEINIAPNPFSSGTKISLSLPQSGMLNADIYNLLGEKISSLLSGEHEAGKYGFEFDPASSGLSPGIYLLKVTTPSHTRSFRLLYTK
jgi:M6 family metalloprotease-like protein